MLIQNTQDELLDLVCSQDTVIGVASRSYFYERNLTSFRVINGFIVNSEKKLWIPRRHASKKLFPLCLDTSVGGHVASGESYDNAFIRETQEELSLKLTFGQYKPIARLTPQDHGVSAFMWVYVISQDITPNYNKADFIEYYWLSPEQIFEKLAQGDKSKGDLPIILKHIRPLL